MKNCSQCEYRKVKPQQISDEIWNQYFCTHPEYTGNNELLKPLLEDGRLIGWDDQPMPDWCPKKVVT